ncbi:MAG: hypothetical protein HY665_02015 [Chloroflexi bacterium]|nr:hypothetical protein [Chloroflexota bacterium]
MVDLLKPARGGFLRPFGCGWFIREYLLGNGPYGSPKIDPEVGAPQADILYHYKNALRRATAFDRATRIVEKMSRRDQLPISPDIIETLAESLLSRMPYKTTGCRTHSFVVYFSNLVRLGWVESTGREEPSAFQDHYALGQPRRYYRLTEAGRRASDAAWRNPLAALYGRRN